MNVFTAADHQARVLRRRLLYTVLGIVLVVAAVVIGLTGIGVDRDDPAAAPRDAVPPATSTSTGTATPQTGDWVVPPVPAGPLILPPPAGTVRGVPVGLPHTVPGAISAAARYAETAIGLDETRAEALGEVAGSPSYPAAAAEFVLGVRGARAGLGIPLGAPLAGAYLVFQARSYRVIEAGPDDAVVQVLGLVEAAGPATSGQGRTATLLVGYELAWVDEDWRLAQPATAEEPDPLPSPGSAQAYEGGWRDLALA
jgi:hypothetical protein